MTEVIPNRSNCVTNYRFQPTFVCWHYIYKR